MSSKIVPVSEINFAEIYIEDRFPVWKEVISVIFESNLKPDVELTSFRANISTYHLSTMLLTHVSSSAQYFNRPRKLIAKDGLDHCLIQIYLEGTTTGQWSRFNNSVVRPGDIFLLDLTKPIESFATDFKCLTLTIPRNALFAKLPQLECLHGKVLPRESMAAKLLGTHIKMLYSLMHTITEEEVAAITEGVINLTAAYFQQTPLDEDCGYVQAATRESIRGYILKNLANPDLKPDTIAQHFRMSRAYLYRLFDSSEGINHYIYEQRLIKAFNCLANPANKHSISQVAYRFGFKSESHFSRSFRQLFGMTASEVKANARFNFKHTDNDTASVNQNFGKWILGLR